MSVMQIGALLFGVAAWFQGVEDEPAVLRAMQDRFRAVATQLRPSLVRIESVGGTQPLRGVASEAPEDADDEEGPPKPKRTQNPFRDDIGSPFVVADGPTTGLVYSEDGYIVTSSFNFVREPALITVTLADGRRLAADLVARDQVRKVALLKVEATHLVVPTWAQTRDIRVGQTAVALGLGFGGDEPSIHVGIVSALNRMRGTALQTDAKLSPANYGGPLCDLSGRVLGISVPMAQRPGELAGVEMYDSGVGFAIPRYRLDPIVDELKTGKSFHRGWLGMVVEPRAQNAVVVADVADPSPMKSAGLQAGDQILTIDGRPLYHFGHMMQALYMLPAGQSVVMQVKRGDAEFSVTVTLARSDELGALPEAEEPFDPAEPLPEPEDQP
jgi:serine protease Do